MYRKITRLVPKNYSRTKNNTRRPLGPTNETLRLIMQFACAYHVEPQLPAPLSEFILN
jgi:hypothetical protein